MGANPYALGGPAAPVPIARKTCPPGSTPTPVVTKLPNGQLHTSVVCKPGVKAGR